MDRQILSVGLDVGTTTTQMVLSRLTVRNRGSSFSVPDMDITAREVIWRGDIHFTPLLGRDRIDGEGVRRLVEKDYRAAGIRREDVDTGAVIITGETSRKENAGAVLAALSDLAGDFVVATAGPGLESALAAKGAGAALHSAQTGKAVLHMDIGGGTANLAWLEEGRVRQTGCLNVGGRLVKFDEGERITYISPVLQGLCALRQGDRVEPRQLEEVAAILVQALEMAAGLRQPTDLLDKLWTREAGPVWVFTPMGAVISFSGGVADCIEQKLHWKEYGDLGPILGRVIRKSRLCTGMYRLGVETIRATVIGAGSHSLQLSGSTVYYRDVSFPMKNLPVVCVTGEEQTDAKCIQRRLAEQDGQCVLFLSGIPGEDYAHIKRIATAIAGGVGEGAVMVALQQDAAKALGQRLALELPGREILCIDGITLENGSYLDVGEPVGSALPVVIKTLILET